MTPSQKARLLGVLFILMFLAFVATAQANVAASVKADLNITDPMIVDGSGCEVLEWIDGAVVSCYGTETPRIDEFEIRLLMMNYKVTRAGAALVVVK